MKQIIKHKKKILAIIVKNAIKNKKKGIQFFSPNNFTQQLGLFNHQSGKIIKPHTHNKFVRKINKTTEVLFILDGVLRVDFYKNKKEYLYSKIVKKNDLIILNEGSHGFKVIKKVKMFEVKQGPYYKKVDKIKFEAVDEKKDKIKK